MRAFTYESPRSLEQALSLLGAAQDKGRVLAGGTDLIIQMRAGVRQPDVVVDVKAIPDLQVLSFSPQDGLRLGAAVSCAQLIEDQTVCRHYPGLTEAAGLIGSIQVQSRCSVGGNLCNGSPAADTTPALIALNAVGHIVGPKGSRTVPVQDFVVSPGRTVLEPGELLVELRIPAPRPHSADCYMRFIPRNEMDIAVVGVGASVTLEGELCVAARIALGAVAATPLFAQEASASLVGQSASDADIPTTSSSAIAQSSMVAGKPLNGEAIAKAAELAMQQARPITDMRGTAEFRKHLVGVLTRRVLTCAAERARKI